MRWCPIACLPQLSLPVRDRTERGLWCMLSTNTASHHKSATVYGGHTETHLFGGRRSLTEGSIDAVATSKQAITSVARVRVASDTFRSERVRSGRKSAAPVGGRSVRQRGRLAATIESNRTPASGPNPMGSRFRRSTPWPLMRRRRSGAPWSKPAVYGRDLPILPGRP